MTDSCADTLIDSDSDSVATTIANTVIVSDDDDVVMVSHSFRKQTALEVWTKRVPRLSLVYQDTCSEHRIRWKLNDNLDSIDILKDQVAYGSEFVRNRLLLQYVSGFKIGITHLPKLRWSQPSWGYSALGYTELWIMCVHADADFIINLERELLSKFRRIDTRDQLINSKGHPLCLNRHRGGESGSHGVAPFCCYLAVRSTVPLSTRTLVKSHFD